MHDPPPKTPPGAVGKTFGSAFSAAVMTFEYVCFLFSVCLEPFDYT